MKSKEQIIEQLNAKIPRDEVRLREGGGGKKFSYLEGHAVVALLNEILGQGNYSYLTEEVRLVHAGDISVHYLARVRLEVPVLGCIFSEVGYGDGIDRNNIGKAHELAAKEAVTDAFKRCAKNLGMRTGLALYDKSQANVDDGEPEEKPAPVRQSAPVAAKAAPRAATIGKSDKGAPKGPSKDEAGQVPAVAVDKASDSAAPSPETREQINMMISQMSKVIIAKKTMTLDEIKKHLSEKYQASKKEDLNDAQARELYTYLKGVMG